MLVQIYKFSREGLRECDIADTLGITRSTLDRWKNQRSDVKKAIQEGRNDSRRSGSRPLEEYFFGQLTPELQELYNEIMESNDVKTSEDLLQRAGEESRKRLFLYVLATSHYNINEALATVNIRYDKVDQWMQEPKFRKMIDEIETLKDNFFESKLIALVDAGDSAATMMVNRTRNAKRGYNPKIEVSVKGEVNHYHEHHIALEDLDLPVDVLRAVVKAQKEYEAKTQAIEGKVIHAKEKEITHD